MKIAIFGAGAIGGYLAFKLHQAGEDVSVIARGDHLAAIRKQGLTLKSNGLTLNARIRATDKAAELGVQDYVFVTLKANALPVAAPEIARLLDSKTVLITASNGIPYWYFHGLNGPWQNHIVESVDPGGELWRLLPPSQVVGCIVFHAAEVKMPGVIEHSYGNRFSLGEPDNNSCERAEAVSRILTNAGLNAPVHSNIRDEIWVKLWGNLAFNPMSALTGLTVDRLAFQPDLRAAARMMMEEAATVAQALGARFSMSVEERIDFTGSVGAHKTSMLQDLERGRPLEIDALLGAVVELGQLTRRPVPLCEAVLALIRARACQAGLYSAPTELITEGDAGARKTRLS